MHSHCPFSVHLCPLVTMCRVFMSTCHAATNAHNATQRHSSPPFCLNIPGTRHRLERQATHSTELFHNYPTHGHMVAVSTVALPTQVYLCTIVIRASGRERSSVCEHPLLSQPGVFSVTGGVLGLSLRAHLRAIEVAQVQAQIIGTSGFGSGSDWCGSLFCTIWKSGSNCFG